MFRSYGPLLARKTNTCLSLDLRNTDRLDLAKAEYEFQE